MNKMEKSTCMRCFHSSNRLDSLACFLLANSPMVAPSKILRAVTDGNSLNLYERRVVKRFRKSTGGSIGICQQEAGCGPNKAVTRLTLSEGTQPFLLIIRILAQRRTQHDAGVLPGEIVCCLAKVHRHVTGTLPELEELRSETVGYTEPVQLLRSEL